MTLDYRDDSNLGRALVCPPDLGGCEEVCVADDDRGADWTCPGCGKEWNIHDAGQALDQLEEDAG